MKRGGYLTTQVIPLRSVRKATASPSLCFEDLLNPRFLQPKYQPIVDLASGRQVAAEALARWPGLGIAPDAAFQWAAGQGRLAELDEACRDAAVGNAASFGLPDGFALFVNLEPSVIGTGTADHLRQRAGDDLDVVVEITERSLLLQPAELLNAICQLRDLGFAIAIDDVGALPASLALLPFIAPDVIKLDIGVVQRIPDGHRTALQESVLAYAARTGCTIVAEGIENAAHLDQALALGATLGQGWYFAHPGQLDELVPAAGHAGSGQRAWSTPDTPFSAIDPAAARVGTKQLLLGLSLKLERQSLNLEIPPVVLGAFQDACHVPHSTAMRYGHLADRCPLVGMVGVDLSDPPAPGVRSAALQPDDPLRDEWVVAVLGPNFAGALIGRDLGDTGPEETRRYAFSLSFDHEVVARAARSVLSRLPSAAPLATPVVSDAQSA